MPEHFTKATVEATFWCAKCGKPTPHTVVDGRRGACLTELARLNEQAAASAAAVKPEAVQGRLF